MQGVSRDKHALGYFGLAYYVENKDKLRAVPIIAKGATKGVGARRSTPSWPAPTSRWRARSSSTWPRSPWPSPKCKEFVNFYLKNAPKLVKEVGYVPLAKAHYDLGIKNFNGKKLGTGFGGKNEVGVRVDELLKREAHL